MPSYRTTERRSRRARTVAIAFSLAAASLLVTASPGWSEDNSQEGQVQRHHQGDDSGQNVAETRNDRAVRLLQTVPVPVSASNTTGGLYSDDISWVDQATQTYYLADRSNKAVDIVDAKTSTFLGQLAANPPFAGAGASSSTSGPDGVTTGGHCLFVTDAPSRIVSFDTSSFPPVQVSDIHTATGDTLRTDELAYDSTDGVILAINNADTPPFGTFISVNKSSCALTLGTRITLDAAHGVDAQNGAEQPVWDPGTGSFYLSIPQIGSTVSSGGVVRIPPNATSVAAVFPIKYCSPAGLALGPHEDLFVGCNMVFDTAGNVWSPTGNVTAAPQDVIIDARNGQIDANVAGVGAGDEVWYNMGDNNYYASGSGSPFGPQPSATAQGSTPLGVVDAGDKALLQLVTTFNVPAVSGKHPSGTAHTVTADAANNHVLAAIAANNAFPNCLTGCIAVFGHPDEDQSSASDDHSADNDDAR
jgi:hypothetical protein